MKLRVIDGGRKNLENRVIKSMMRGHVCADDLDRLKPWGNLYLVGSSSPTTKPKTKEHSSRPSPEDTASR